MLAILFRAQCVNFSSVSPVCMQDPNFIISVLADVLAPNGARPSAGTVMTVELYTFPS